MAQRNYITKQGDTWSLIAWRVYGDGMQIVRLLDANPDLAHVLQFDSEPHTIVVPEWTPPRVKFVLPPWQEVNR